MNKWSVLDAEYTDDAGVTRKVFDPHSAQLKLSEDQSRFLIATAGRRLGKSQWVGKELVPEAFRARKMKSWLESEQKRLEFWSVGPKYSDAEKPFRVFYNTCKALGLPFDKPGTYYSLESGNMTVSLWDGAFIYSAKSAQYPDTLVGEGLSGVHVEEAAKMKEGVWTQMLMPSSYLTSMVGQSSRQRQEGKNWYYRLHRDAEEARKLNWNAHRLPAWMNPHVYKTPTVAKDVKRMMHTMAEHPELSSFEIHKQMGLTIDEQILQMANRPYHSHVPARNCC